MPRGPKHLEGQLTSLKRNGNATQKKKKEFAKKEKTVGFELRTSRVEVHYLTVLPK